MASFFKSPKKGHSHTPSKPKLPSNCEICHRKFGLFVQKHQCSKCKQIICGHCSGRKHLRDPRLCTKCNPPATKAAPPPTTPTKAVDWRCGACGFVNEAHHHSCFACSSPKQEQSTAPKPKDSPALDGAILKWWCAVCTFENQLLDTSKVSGKAGERVIAPNSSGNKDHAIIKSHNSDGTFNLLFDNLDIKLHVPAEQLQKEAPEPKCRICNAGKPEFSYPFWACPTCTLANILSRANCELCSGARPNAGPALMKSQQTARDSDILLVKDSAPTPAKRPGDFTLLASDMAELQKQIELVKKVLEKKAPPKETTPTPAPTTTETPATTTETPATTTETETKTEPVTVTSASNEAIAEAILATIAATEPEKKEKKKVKKGVRFGFADVEPAVPTSRLAYARATTLNFKKKSKMAPSGGGKKPSARGKFAITLKSEWLEAEMNVQKMMGEWDSLNKKAIALAKVEEKETPTETPSAPLTPSESPATSIIEEEDEEQAHFKKLQEAFAQMSEEEKEKERQEAAAAKAADAAEEHHEETSTSAPESTTTTTASEPTTTTTPTTTEPTPTTTEPTPTTTEPTPTPTTTEPTPTPTPTTTEPTPAPTEPTPTTTEPTPTPTTTTETTTTTTTETTSTTEDIAESPAESSTDFAKVAFTTPYASVENTPEPSPASTPTGSHRSLASEDKSHDLSLERELFAYLEGNMDRMKAFSAHSQRYADGKMTAFLYYYMIGKTFGDELVPIVLPLLLKALGTDTKKQEALRCYHLFAISKGCGRCNKIVYLPEEVRFAEKSWHRWCFKCMDCGITLDLKSVQSKNKKIYCSKHVPKE